MGVRIRGSWGLVRGELWVGLGRQGKIRNLGESRLMMSRVDQKIWNFKIFVEF